MEGDKAAETGEIPEDIQSAHESQESRTTEGKVQNRDEALEEEPIQADEVFKLEADSEDEQAGYDDQDEEDEEDVQRNGYGVEMLTETAEDQMTSENAYDDEDADYASSQRRLELEQSGQQNEQQYTEGGSYMSQSYLTKNSKSMHATNLDASLAEDLASKEALARLKMRIQKQAEHTHNVDPDEVVDNLKGHQFEKKPLDNDRLDLFFYKNKFLSEFKDQTDQVAVHECYKAMFLKQFQKSKTVFRYGTTGDECYFILKGKIKLLCPEKQLVDFRDEEDMIRFYAENFDEVIWSKVEDAEEIKEMARLYLQDPEKFDFEKEDIEVRSPTLPKRVQPLERPLRHQVNEIQEELSRPGSAYSRASSKNAKSRLSKNNKHTESQHESRRASNFTNSNYEKDANLGFGQSKKSQARFASRASFFAGDRSLKETEQQRSTDHISEHTHREEVWLFKDLGELGPGDSFGEVALVQSKPHLMTYLCVEDCEIASINRESYIRIVEKAVKRDFLGRIQFLKSFKIFTSMSQTQLENLLYHVKLIEFNRGRTIFKHGDKPDGVYLIQEGAFELSRPGQIQQQTQNLVEKMNVDPMAKFQLKKQAKVIKDSSRMIVKLAILGSGEVFGLEECSVRPTSTRLKNRGYTVTCTENGSKAIFINHQAFSDKVLYDPNVEKTIKFDCALKEFFHNSRELQYQQTVWNGSLTTLKQIENAAEKAEAEFEERLKRDNQGLLSSDLKGLPRLRTVDQYFKEKFEAEILNKIMGQIQHRAAESMIENDQEMQQMVTKKMRQIENHFDNTVNVINADRKQQKKNKEKLKELSEIQRAHEHQFSISLAASKALTSQGSIASNPAMPAHMMEGLQEQSYFQDSIISSHPGEFTTLQQIDQYHSLQQNRRGGPQHFASVDNTNMKVIHSVVKEKQPLELVEEPNAFNMKFVSMDQDISLKGANRRDITVGPIEKSDPSEVKDSQKLNSGLGLNSDTQTVAQISPELKARRDKSIVIDQQENQMPAPLLQVIPTSGGRSDGIEFNGLRDDSEAKMLSVSHTPKIVEKSESQFEKKNTQMPSTSQPAMNRTQDAFNNKEKKLLEMFEDQKPQDIDQDKSDAANQEQIAEQQQAAQKVGNDGGVIVKNRQAADQPQKPMIQTDKRNSHVTESNKHVPAPTQQSGRQQDVQVRELSDTTANPSNLGNVSSIRDPRYSQDMAQNQKLPQKPGGAVAGKKRLGLSSNIGPPGQSQKPTFGLLNLDSKQIKIPKANAEKDGTMPVYAEGDEMAEAAEVAKAASNTPQNAPVVNITTRLTSKRSSNTRVDDSKDSPLKSSPIQTGQNSQADVPKDNAASEEKQRAGDSNGVFKPQGPLGNELPFNDFVNKSGFKGAVKRNQVNYISKTINDRSIKSKLRMINKDSANPLPADQVEALQNMSNSFTADMPELYTVAPNLSQHPAPQNLNHQHGRNAANTNMFPTISGSGSYAHRNQQTTLKDGFLRNNADISMIDTAMFSTSDHHVNQQMTPQMAGPSKDIMRVVETHQSNQSKKEVFVPSQINPRMKRQTGKALADKRAVQKQMAGQRGASAKSFDTKGSTNVRGGVKGGMITQNKAYNQQPGHKRMQSLRTTNNNTKVLNDDYNAAQGGQMGSFVQDGHSSRHQSFDQTGNSYAKQMQNPDDTQYRAAMMREARQQQMVMEAARSAAGATFPGDENQLFDTEGNFDGSNQGGVDAPFSLSPAAAAAASELIQRFITNPSEPISTDHFLYVQRKYELPPFEAYQLLLQQIQFQKALLTPPTAATVIKVSHNSYTQSVRDKREEVISFRNDLFKRYTYMRKKKESVSTSKGKSQSNRTGQMKPVRTSSINTGTDELVKAKGTSI